MAITPAKTRTIPPAMRKVSFSLRKSVAKRAARKGLMDAMQATTSTGAMERL